MKKSIAGLSMVAALVFMAGCGGSSGGGSSEEDIKKAGAKLENICKNAGLEVYGDEGELKDGGTAEWARCKGSGYSSIMSEWKQTCESIDYYFEEMASDNAVYCLEKPIDEFVED